ncbi:hypothetical protein A9Q86_01365 [Flavobacteriales bacterium 33_180_T64]|nr:hypothetical protein A9Q86_01365 [Flavobacteriales bacterium 33_180_T64]
MQAEIGSLLNYPYISYENHISEIFKLESLCSADLIWNTKCALKCQINNQQMVMPSNSIVLLDKGNSFSCESTNLSQVKVLRFNTEIFSSSLIFICGFINASTKNNFKNHTILFFKDEQRSLIENTFIFIEDIIKETTSINVEKLKHTLCSLLQNALKEKFSNDIKYINCFGEILNSQFSIFHNVSDYAAQLDVEPKNLLRLFQKKGLKNPSEIIKDKLLFESKKRIIYTSKSIREICFEVGFYDPAYFSRFFKKHTGVTAQYFRKQYKSSSHIRGYGKKCNTIESQ